MLMFDSSRLYNPDKTQFSLTGGLKFIGDGIVAVVQPQPDTPLLPKIKGKILFKTLPSYPLRMVLLVLAKKKRGISLLAI